MALISSQRLLDVARVAAIIACVGFLYSPSVASIGLIVCYVAFLTTGRDAWSRLRLVCERPLGYWGLAFLAVVVVGMGYAQVLWHDRGVDLLKWRTILWLLVVAAIFDEEKWKKRLLGAFVFATAIGVVASFVAASGLVKLWASPEHLLRISVTQGMAFASAVLFSVWMIAEHKVAGRWVWGLSLLVAIYMANIVFITNGRSGYALLGLGLFILLSWKASWKQRGALLLGLLICSGLALVASPKVQGKIGDAIYEWKGESELQNLTSFGIRRVYYTNSLELAKEHWLVGVGTGGFAKAYGEHIGSKYEASDWRAIRTTDPHNQYLAIWVQHGLLGLLVFLGWLMAIALDHGGSSEYRGLAIALLAGWCVTSLFSSHFRTFVEGHLLATFLGVLLANGVPAVNGRLVATAGEDI